MKTRREMFNKQVQELERIANLTKDEAKEYLLRLTENELIQEKVTLIKDYEAKLKEECVVLAQNLVATAIQKCASDYVSETTVSVVALPNDDMKGRIIGRRQKHKDH